MPSRFPRTALIVAPKGLGYFKLLTIKLRTVIMIKKMLLLLILFSTLFLPIHVFATTVDITGGSGETVSYIVSLDSTDTSSWAGQINAQFGDSSSYIGAYCVDFYTDITDKGYSIDGYSDVLSYTDTFFTKGNGLYAAWLMNEYSSWLGYTGYGFDELAASEAGLQLAIWDALYDGITDTDNDGITDTDNFVVTTDTTTTAAYAYYSEYIAALLDADLTDFTGENFQVVKLTDAQDLIVYNPVPEPGTVILFGIGLLGISGIVRKKKA